MTVLSTSKPQADTEVDATALASNFIAIEAVVNGALDEGNFTTGLLYSPSKLKQGGAATGDTLVWSGSAWVPGQGGTPTGVVADFAGSSAPTGWLLCDGTEVLRSTYADLDAVIGTTYGAYTNGSGGAGTTHLRLPNAKGRVIVHRDSGQTEFDTLGETNSSATKTHTLTTGEMPSHTHTDSGHTHTGAVSGFQGFGDTTPVQGNAVNSTSTTFPTGSSTANLSNTGGGGAHNNLQPYMVMNKIIKT